jgi:hypothetical protein
MKVLAKVVIVVATLFVMSVSVVLAQDACEGNFDCDQDVDGTDAAVFKSDFGRSAFKNPCPDCPPPAPVPKTGQTTVYGSRDDGYWQQALGVEWPDPRFTDNGDGTVTDNLTGLIWLKNAGCFGPRNWNEALSDSNGLEDGECGLTDGSITGNWRLPNRFELQSLLDSKNFDPAIPIEHPFNNVTNINYWSSTTYAGIADEAWSVFMFNGIVSFVDKTNLGYAWPVRGGQ